MSWGSGISGLDAPAHLDRQGWSVKEHNGIFPHPAKMRNSATGLVHGDVI